MDIPQPVENKDGCFSCYGSKTTLEVYEVMGVLEVWVYDDHRLTILCFAANQICLGAD